MNRTRALSLNTAVPPSKDKDGDDGQSTPTRSRAGPAEGDAPEPETVLSRLRSEAAKRLKDLQKAEDAADEALLRFGSNVRDFLRDAISVAPPDDSAEGSTILFESKDAQGKRVIHTSRFDAQLHVIHTSTEGLAKDPSGAEFEAFATDFDVDEKTGDISGDLSWYPELRSTMERLVPDQVSYADFWKRYYYLRHGIETAESRRRDLLKGKLLFPLPLSPWASTDSMEAAEAEEEVGWDDDSEDESDKAKGAPAHGVASGASSTTLQPKAEGQQPKASESRKSNDEKSQADSEGSYDVVGAASGKTSHAPNSPKEAKKDDDSDDDWE